MQWAQKKYAGTCTQISLINMHVTRCAGAFVQVVCVPFANVETC